MNQIGVDPEAFRFALAQITDGNVFEGFGLDFLAKVLQYEFMPAGGLRDRGIDGFEHTYHRRRHDLTIYQLSIQKDYKSKIKGDLNKLKANKIRYSHFYYVTNIPIPAKEQLVDELSEEYKKPITIYDERWLASHVNDSEATLRAFNIFVESHLHKFNRPGQSYIVANLEGDPRLYVFLRQQWEEQRGTQQLDLVLVDTLILYALEETDPGRGILMTRAQILDRIAQLVRFDPRLLHSKINERLRALSTKPRRINHHMKEDAYCLRFEERLAIQNRNLNDAALYESFRLDTAKDIINYLPGGAGLEDDYLNLVEQTLQRLYYEQGLEFADFILHGSGKEIIEKSLPDIIGNVVNTSGDLKKQEVKNGLLICIRNMVYNGTPHQKTFLNRLSHTYTMLFLLQCDPKIATFFGSLASKLQVYVCTSILIPALSEHFLEDQNKRYSNLLLGARDAGVHLLINEIILSELAAHFRMIRGIYKDRFEGNEDLYTDEMEILYIQEIMIRAYFYTRIRGNVRTFDEFIGAFVSPAMNRLKEDLVELLGTEFGVDYAENASLGISLDKQEVDSISRELAQYKSSPEKARNDAQVILTIFALRERNNELGSGSIFGYRTWWLSSDVNTQKACTSVLGDKYESSCYMRPDFLYNYISLAPRKGEVDRVFQELFPTLLGVNISFNMPIEVTQVIHGFVKDYKAKNPARVKAALRELSDNLKQDPNYRTRDRVKLFLDERLKHLLD